MTNNTFCSNPLYTVYIFGCLYLDNKFHCAIGSNCIRFKVTVSKKTVERSLCPHEHISTLLSDQSGPASSEQPVICAPCPKFNESEWMANTSDFLFREKKLDLSRPNKKVIEKMLLKIRNEGGWPKLFVPKDELCPSCSTVLASPVKHSGMEWIDHSKCFNDNWFIFVCTLI